MTNWRFQIILQPLWLVSPSRSGELWAAGRGAGGGELRRRSPCHLPVACPQLLEAAGGGRAWETGGPARRRWLLEAEDRGCYSFKCRLLSVVTITNDRTWTRGPALSHGRSVAQLSLFRLPARRPLDSGPWRCPLCHGEAEASVGHSRPGHVVTCVRPVHQPCRKRGSGAGSGPRARRRALRAAAGTCPWGGFWKLNSLLNQRQSPTAT